MGLPTVNIRHQRASPVKRQATEELTQELLISAVRAKTTIEDFMVSAVDQFDIKS